MKNQTLLYLVSPYSHSSYKHRRNKDGTFDSICLRCYQTISTAQYESLLETAESEHRCEEADQGRFL
jgi:hypothetical protein